MNEDSSTNNEDPYEYLFHLILVFSLISVLTGVLIGVSEREYRNPSTKIPTTLASPTPSPTFAPWDGHKGIGK